MRWMKHILHMGEMRNEYIMLVGRPEGKEPLGDVGIGKRMILEWVLEK
jgi:hypothetical protein